MGEKDVALEGVVIQLTTAQYHSDSASDCMIDCNFVMETVLAIALGTACLSGACPRQELTGVFMIPNNSPWKAENLGILFSKGVLVQKYPIA